MTTFEPFMKVIQGLLISQKGIATHLTIIFEVLRQKLDTARDHCKVVTFYEN